MTYDALVIDDRALGVLDAALIDEAWFSEFSLPPDNSEGLRRIVVDDMVYLLSDKADDDSRLLVVNLKDGGVFQGAQKHRARFERILRVALRHLNRNITLPVQWQAYHEGPRVSLFAEASSRKSSYRLYFDQAAGGCGDIYAYGVTDGPRPLHEVNPDARIYQRAREHFSEAALAEPALPEPVGNFGILLAEPLGKQLASGGTLEEWLERKLNPDQLKFVQKPHDKPVRLRGVAGTGKTQAMAVKCLHDLYAAADDALTPNRTFAFLTHSSALAHEVVRGMFYALDPSERWAKLCTDDGQPMLWIGTLYELAQQQLNYTKKGLSPLSLDGREGRSLQRIVIGDAIEQVAGDPRVMLGILGEQPDFSARLLDKGQRPVLIEELMNEFACVLDVDNVRKGTLEADRYVRGSREAWQMHLPDERHRQAVLEIHDAYRTILKNEKLLSMDQMIADYGRYLSTHEWEQLRDRDGFDLIFVDEYHYFTRAESMTLQYLFKSRANCSGRWPLIMAYDLKQSTSDGALGGGLEKFRNPGIGKSAEVELRQNYRSTPQIAAFLEDLDGSFPAMDLEGEYSAYVGASQQANGDIPVLQTYDTDLQLLDGVFEKASIAGRELGGRNVAVLCLSEDLFDVYLSASRIQGKYVSITSREDLKELQRARGRCVFSMPEYVAGLQFDTVFLLHADQADLAQEHLSQGARRRYVSRVYLGASRAQKHLSVSASQDRGGPSEILSGPLQNRSLIKG
jgi:hypothetical protein